MEYPKDYNLINVGGSAQAFLSLTSGRIDAAIIAVPLNYEAAQMGYPVIAKVVDFIPNYQLTDVTVKRSWAEKNRPLLVRFMRYYTNPLNDVEGYLHSQKGGGTTGYVKPEDRKP